MLPGYVRSRLNRRPIYRALADDSLIMDDKTQPVYIYNMHINANMLLVAVTDTLSLTLH
jgi:hypothetical protein